MSNAADEPKSSTTALENSQDQPRAKRNTGPRPCEKCRSQHLKCVYGRQDSNSKCQRCNRTGHECIKITKKIRFRDVPASRFFTNQNAGKANGRKPSINLPSIEDLDTSQASGETGDRDNIAGGNAAVIRAFDLNTADTYLNVDPHKSNDVDHVVASSHAVITDRTQPSSLDHLTVDSNPMAIRVESGTILTPPKLLPTLPQNHFSFSAIQDSVTLPKTLTSTQTVAASFNESPYRHGRSTSTSRFLGSMVKHSTQSTAHSVENYVENILLRYFRTELAPWFDLCDPDHHFANVVPQKAREAGPLRSAILTIAARNMSRNKRFRNSAGVVEWDGRPLPNLNEDFAVPYHNECIRDLLQLSMDPRKLHDETLLAAVLTLRTDEEMGLSAGEQEEDQELFLRVASIFIDAQLPQALALPHSSPEVFQSTLLGDGNHSNMPSPSVHTEDLGASGLRQACFWTAFRQDLHAAFLKQQPVRFPLSRCEIFRQTTPATDAIWANRMVTFCADVLEFSYGSDSSDGKILPSYTDHKRWQELRDREQIICALLPTSFEPTFCSEPDLLHGVFPEIWYLDPCHVSGTTYIELARMLLEVFNPTRPKLGHGFLAATNAFITSTKRILFRLCGIALSNHQHCPPCLINACLGISMFGEYFEDPIEQDALLGVLALMHNQYAYPTNQIAQSLRCAWNSEELERTTSAVFFNSMEME